ncbi:lysozyme [Devosia lucknowensis]|uniref:Lysozyme n=1 Tax=Devosia lucknowensis TaxID=1096929 RepID=A0A1Y6GCX9_9HYPH|nr:GH25 family lysozyme [Devosia lucknowensis]SMQ85929.1 lysozyme [Devosia lucknowensis]
MVFSARRSVSAVLRGAVLSLAVAALVACGSVGGLYGAIPGDNRPHAKVDRARGMPIQGIDVARYQENVDFARARGAGIHFVFMKATEGKDYIDPNFRVNWERARDAGMPRGAYHFMTWCSTAAEQAAWFVQNVPADPSALPPVLDLEWNNHSSCKVKPSKADALEKINVMLTAMERHTGKLPIIYTDMNFHRDILEDVYLPNTFWLRSTAAEPHERYKNRPWTFWQYTQTGVVPGVKGEVDRNVFYGSTGDWLMFLSTGCDPRAMATLQASGRCQFAK